MACESITYAELTERYAGVEQSVPLYQVDRARRGVVAYLPVMDRVLNVHALVAQRLRHLYPGCQIQVITVQDVPAARNFLGESA